MISGEGMRTVIIGGGITGLSAAWELQQQKSDYVLLEASDRWGGKIISREIEVEGNRFLVEGGPDTLVTRKRESWQLALELGLHDDVVNPGSETKNIYVVDSGRPYPIPLSLALFFSTPLLTWRGKLRLISEPFQPARRDDEDESLAGFVTRRLGKEALEKFIGPVLGGIYNTDPHKQSIMVSSPIMREMEKESGSLVLAVVNRMFRKRNNSERLPRFINFRRGMMQLTDELARQLTGDLRLNARVMGISRADTGFAVHLADGTTLAGDALILATLANVSAELLGGIAPQAAEKLAGIQHNHIGTISLVFNETDIPPEPVINGLMIPRREKRDIDAMTFTSRKSPERSAPGYAFLRVFLGGGNPGIVASDDETLVDTVCRELQALVGITARPLAYTVFRWESGFPQAEVGHLGRVAEIETLLPEGIYLAGSSYRGIAVPDCIKQGREAAKKIIQSQISPLLEI
jgi:oxygen-dependent protoporphyrinogen oxidase